MRHIAHSVIALLVLTLGGLTTGAWAETRPDEVFTVEDLLKGTTSTKEQCAALETAVWVEVEGRGDCIRYYAAGLKERNASAIFYLHGGRLWGPADPARAGSDPVAYAKMLEVVRAGYLDNTVAAEKEQVRWLQAGLDIPLIKIARPGAYGSSGEHKNRIQMREELLVTAAIEAIAKRYNIENLAVTGNSEGGNIAAFVLTKIPALKCSVLTSSALSLETIAKIDPTNGYLYSPNTYNPMKHIADIPHSDRRRIFGVGDPSDVVSPIANQKEFFEAVKAAGHAVWFVASPTAAGGSHHTLDRTGMHISKWCLEDLPTDEILKRVSAGALRG